MAEINPSWTRLSKLGGRMGRNTTATAADVLSACKHCGRSVYSHADGDGKPQWSRKPIGWVHTGCHQREGGQR